MIQGFGLLVAAVGAAVLWGAVTGNNPADELLRAIGAGGGTSAEPRDTFSPEANRQPLPTERDAPAPATPSLPPHLRYP